MTGWGLGLGVWGVGWRAGVVRPGQGCGVPFMTPPLLAPNPNPDLVTNRVPVPTGRWVWGGGGGGFGGGKHRIA